jgi:DNA-binding HxlR family transcriptional regulator
VISRSSSQVEPSRDSCGTPEIVSPPSANVPVNRCESRCVAPEPPDAVVQAHRVDPVDAARVEVVHREPSDGARMIAIWLARAVEGISDSVLSDRLSALCDAKLVTRNVDEGPPISVAYELTDTGRALLPALEQISRWAEEHLSSLAELE